MEAVMGTPWAIEERVGRRMLAVLEQRINGFKEDHREPGDKISAAEGGDRRRGTQTGAIYVLPIYGILAPRMDVFMEMCGGSSVARLMKDFDAAVADETISTIVLEFDSGGGSVGLIPEFGAKIRAARDTKKVVGHINTECYSAAYWLAAQCSEVVITKSGGVGSVGVFMLHMDQSGYDEQEGLKYTLIKAGKYKAEGMSHFPLSEEANDHMKGIVDQYNGMFLEALADGRGKSVKEVRENFGEGRTMTAKEAVKAGLVDRIASFDEVINKLTGRSKGNGARGEGEAPAIAASAEAAVEVVADEEVETTLADRARELNAEASAPTRIEVTEPISRGGEGGPTNASPAPAAQAKEQQMTEEEKAAQAAADAERARVKGLRTLAKQHASVVTEEMVDKWLEEGTSVADAKSQVLEAHGSATASARVRVTGVKDNAEDKPFASLGDQLSAIKKAGTAMKSGGAIDPRLHRVNREINAALGGVESTPSDAGFALQADISLALIDPMFERGQIMSRVRRVPFPTGRNDVKILAGDETNRANGQRLGGVQMFWRAEGDAGTPKRPKTRLINLDAKKLMGLAYSSNESEEDIGLLSAIYEPAFREELEFVSEDSVIRALGGGQPLGILGHDATVSAAIEAGQTKANTAQSIAANVANMLRRIPPRYQDRVVFLFTPELLPKLVTATIGAGGAAAPVYLPANGLAGVPFNTILGKPAFISEFCEAEGTPGDIIAAVFDQYLWADKGGPKMSTSVHVQFLTDETAWKLTYRCDGQPAWRTAVTPYKGADTLAPFVTLAARA